MTPPSASLALLVALFSLGCGGSPGGGAQASLNCSSVKSPADRFSTGRCSACLKASCCSETSACAANADCVALTACWNACNGNACLLACEDAHAAGKADFLGARTCSSSHCTYSYMGGDYQCSFSF